MPDLPPQRPGPGLHTPPRDPASFLHARRHLLSPRLPPHIAPPYRAKSLATASTPPRPPPYFQPLACCRRPTSPMAPPPPSSLSPTSEGSTAAGRADALPSPALHAVRRRPVHPLRPMGPAAPPITVHKGGAWDSTGWHFPAFPGLLPSGGHIAQSGGPLTEPAEFTAAATGSSPMECITPSSTRFVHYSSELMPLLI
jgi:hypothetical protein